MRKISKYNFIGLLIVLILMFMSAGYALYNQSLGLNGDITLKKNGKIEIVNASIVESECEDVSNYTNPTIDGLNLSFNISGSSNKMVATYLVDVTNNSFYDYTYTNFSFNANSDTGNSNVSVVVYDTSTGEVVNPGEVIASMESKTFKVQFTIETEEANTQVNINGDASFTNDKTGNVIASITPKTGNLQGSGTIACFTVSVANTYTYSRNFVLSSSNDNILLINKDGSSLSTLQVDANSTKDYEVCTKVSDNSSFLTEETTTTISLSSTGINTISVGELTLSVDVDVIAADKEIPTVGNVNISIPSDNTVVGEAVVSWDRIDSGGSSITNYYILLYNSDTNTSTTYETGSGVTSYTISNLSAGNYYAKVYGVDEAGNIGSSYCESATSDNGYCSLSNTTSLKWEYTVTYSLTNLKHDDSTSTTSTAILNQSFTTTLALNTTSTWYSLPNSVTITMGDTQLTSGTDYTYSSSSGTITINKVTDDITITASASGGCLIKGTQIVLANGKYKNIEDITYNDLLLVWNYETGNYTYEYPIWLEKEKFTTKYQKTTFSDGSVLKTYGEHGVFSSDYNMFISVNDRSKFNIGSNIVKLDGNNINIVTVTNIEIINEETYYYHVVSTRYYNVIANDFITTDGSVILSNLYEFGNKINWLDRDINNLDLYTYDDFKDIMPLYMYKGLRVEEGKVLSNYLDLETFRNYLLFNQLNDNMILYPNTDSYGNRLWMVTTSDDTINNNYNNYLMKENSYYILKEPQNKFKFKYWYNTADGKKYMPNESVKVLYGMHFVAVYE